MSKHEAFQEHISKNRGMTAKRRIIDGTRNFFTYLSAALAVFVLGSIFVFVFQRGSKTLSWNLITEDFHTVKYMVNFTQQEAGDFAVPDDLKEGEYFSTKYGFGVMEGTDAAKNSVILLTRKAEESPLHSGVNAVAGDTKDKPQDVPTHVNVVKIAYKNQEGETKSAGQVRHHTPQEFVETLDQESTGIVSMNYQSLGGGIRGSIRATLMLIGLTLLISLPIGIFAAIYLHEIAPKNGFTNFIRSSVEMLNGVPSIVFGLMGMAVFFPITAAFGATTPNILLGAITMAVVLLPVTIRQTEEALITVPDKLRMGSLSLGATQTQTIFKVVLPNALPGILTSILLSVSRIIGESAALIYTMGTFVVDNPHITGRATTLAVQIWSVMSGEQPNFELATAISILVLIIVLVLNVSIKLITRQLNKKWKE